MEEEENAHVKREKGGKKRNQKNPKNKEKSVHVKREERKRNQEERDVNKFLSN